MSTGPAYASTPLGFNYANGPVQVSAANTNRDGTGTIVQVVVGRAPGTRIERVRFNAIVATTAGVLRIFKKGSGLTRNADGTIAAYAAPTWRLVKELLVTANTPSVTVAAFSVDWVPDSDEVLSDAEQLGASTHIAEAFNVIAYGGNL